MKVIAFGIRRASKDKDDRMFFLKDSFIEKYENEVFIMKEDLSVSS